MRLYRVFIILAFVIPYMGLHSDSFGAESMAACVTEMAFSAVLPEPFGSAAVHAHGEVDIGKPDVVRLTKLSLRIGKKDVEIPKVVYADLTGTILRTLQLQYTRLGSDDEWEFDLVFRYEAYTYESDRVLIGRPQAIIHIVNGKARRLITRHNINDKQSEITTLDLMTNKRSTVIVQTRLEDL